MVDGTEYNVRNIADTVRQFYKDAIAPYGMGMSFMPTDRNENVLINTANIVAIIEMSDEEVASLNVPEEPEIVVGLRETEVEVEGLETELPEVSQ